MTISVLVFLLRKGRGGVLEVCLGKRKTKYAHGMWNAPGGKVKSGEGIFDAAIREVKEEVDLSVKKEDLVKKAEIKYYEPGGNWLVHAFVCKKWVGEFKETNEILPRWFSVNKLPYEKMWENDKLWWPSIFAGKCVKGEIWHDENDHVIKSKLKEVRKLI